MMTSDNMIPLFKEPEMPPKKIDPRCTETSWMYGKGSPRTPYGPGGFNRCIYDQEDGHPVHQDEWGNRWVMEETGFRSLPQR